MLVLIGASASGKTEIAKLLINKHGFSKIITYTTRKKRANEIDDIDYHFIDTDTFLKKQAEGFFLETTSYSGHLYGTAFKDATPYRVVIVDIDGANTLYKKLGNKGVIMYIETKETLRKKRMKARGDDPVSIQKRLLTDRERFKKSHVDHIDYVINNENHHLEAITDYIALVYKDNLA